MREGRSLHPICLRDSPRTCTKYYTAEVNRVGAQARWVVRGNILNTPQGAGENRWPRGGWVGQRPKKDQGPICFFGIVYGVFLLSSPRNAPKHGE
jgi:hypothetical protein